MNSLRRLLTGLTLGGLILMGFNRVPTVAAQTPADYIYVVTHVDIAGTPDVVKEATRLLREFSADSKKDPGVVRFELLLQDARLNHFTIVAVWQSRQAFEAHAAAEYTRRFRQNIQPMLGSPFDERLHNLLN